jgi:hypothetical protein
LDASVRIRDTDHTGLERLLRYCARPPFALEHLHTLDAEHLLYHNPKPRSDSPRELVLTPLELIDKIAALIPPPRAHRHRYFGVLAPNSPMRADVTAMAPMPVIVQPPAEATTADAPPHRAASHYLWAMLLARIYETLPLVCPMCQSPMRIIAFITEGSSVREILNHLVNPPCRPVSPRHAGRRSRNWSWRGMILRRIQHPKPKRRLSLISGLSGDECGMRYSSRRGRLCRWFKLPRAAGVLRGRGANSCRGVGNLTKTGGGESG